MAAICPDRTYFQTKSANGKIIHVIDLPRFPNGWQPEFGNQGLKLFDVSITQA